MVLSISSEGTNGEITIAITLNPIQQTCFIKTNVSIGEIKVIDQIGKVVIDDKLFYDTDLDFSFLPS